jgi:membrane-bound lytic murein transglycosylase B
MVPLVRVVLAAAMLVPAGVALAQGQGCQKEPTFNAWLAGVKVEALASGLSQSAVNAALAAVKFDPAIVQKDRAQSVFTQDFLTFAGRMVASYRLKDGAANLAKYASTFARIEKIYGVPAPVLAAFWGLETDFGANLGKDPILVSLATLAYDCRRPDMFREEFLAALAIVDRGDLQPAEMNGSWAGELGQLRRRPADRHGEERAGRAGFRGEVPPAPWLAGGRALADRGQPRQAAALGAGGHRDQITGVAMGGVGRDPR